jgi:Domain of unknown function (DUF4160)
MPTIARLSNSKICIYADDHNPPHFNLRGPNSKANINIRTFEVMKGKASRTDLAEAKEWVNREGNMQALLDAWSKLNERD